MTDEITSSDVVGEINVVLEVVVPDGDGSMQEGTIVAEEIGSPEMDEALEDDKHAFAPHSWEDKPDCIGLGQRPEDVLDRQIIKPLSDVVEVR